MPISKVQGGGGRGAMGRPVASGRSGSPRATGATPKPKATGRSVRGSGPGNTRSNNIRATKQAKIEKAITKTQNKIDEYDYIARTHGEEPYRLFNKTGKKALVKNASIDSRISNRIKVGQKNPLTKKISGQKKNLTKDWDGPYNPKRDIKAGKATRKAIKRGN